MPTKCGGARLFSPFGLSAGSHDSRVWTGVEGAHMHAKQPENNSPQGHVSHWECGDDWAVTDVKRQHGRDLAIEVGTMMQLLLGIALMDSARVTLFL